MTFQEFERYHKELLDKSLGMAATKGSEYANGEDRFGNFNRLSERLGISRLQVAWIYVVKHIDAVENFVKTGETKSLETFEERIVDIITYCSLIAGMALEDEILKESESRKKEEVINSPKHPGLSPSLLVRYDDSF